MRNPLPTFLAALLTITVFVCLAGYQVTSETAAPRLLGRLAAALIQIDRWLPAHSEDIDLLARDRPDSLIRLNDLPLGVFLPASQVLASDQDARRDLIVAEMGRTLYTSGNAAFQDDEGARHSLGFTEPLRWSVSFLGDEAHGLWQAALLLSLLVLLASLAGVLMVGGSPLVPLSVGTAVSAAGCLGAWLLSKAASAAVSSAVDKEIMFVLRDGAWIGLRDTMAVGVVLVAVIVLLGMLRPQRARERVWTPDTALPPDAPSA